MALIRGKLQEQVDRKLTGQELYSSYANLGTFLILWQLQEGFADKAQAKQRLQEGLGYVKQSIAINPQAHFGREIWQAVILEFLIAAIDRPDLILQYDFIGNRLDAEIDPQGKRSFDEEWPIHTRILSRDDMQRISREHISRVGAEGSWSQDVPSSQPQPVPFDEPTLGIIGMWRLGSGANPYSR